MRVRSPCVLHQPAARAPPGSSAARGARLPGPGRAGPLRPAPPAAAHSCQSVSPCGFLPFTFPFSETESAEPPSPGVSEKFTKGRGFGSGRAGRGWGAVAPGIHSLTCGGGRISVAEGRREGAKRLRKRRRDQGRTQRPLPRGLGAGGGAGGRAGLRSGLLGLGRTASRASACPGPRPALVRRAAWAEGWLRPVVPAGPGGRRRDTAPSPVPPPGRPPPLCYHRLGGGLPAAGRGAPPRGRRLFQGGSVRRPARPWGPAPSW